MTDSNPPRRYTNEEAAAILSRALDRQNGEGGRISHDELLETAREIGVTTDELEAAVIDEVRARAEQLVREEQRARTVRGFLRHVGAFGVGNAALCLIDKRFTGGTWFYWVGLAWAIALALHAAKTFLPGRGGAPAMQPGEGGAPRPIDLPTERPRPLAGRKPAATTGDTPVPPGPTEPQA
jgi:2TM domain